MASDKNWVVVAGDVCLDVVGVPIPPPVKSKATDNWRQTGETLTKYLPGGVFLLETMLKEAMKDWHVEGLVAELPEGLGPAGTIQGQDPEVDPIENLVDHAERLTRNEVIHSLLNLDEFPTRPGEEKARQIRVSSRHGFSGPAGDDEPSLKLIAPQQPQPKIIVLDDTGNRFRRSREHWPAAFLSASPDQPPLVIYKLHYPLPANQAGSPFDLWQEVASKYLETRIVIISVDDLRGGDVAISHGLSWERTALDVVWQLLRNESFSLLRDCPHLIIRMGSDGAIYWRKKAAACAQPGGDEDIEKSSPVASEDVDNHQDLDYEAWLIYDPAGIEGTGEHLYEGGMVGCTSAFTAGFTRYMASLLAETPDSRKVLQQNVTAQDGSDRPSLVHGIMDGLKAVRRLYAVGYGTDKTKPSYPGSELFQSDPILSADGKSFPDPGYACQPIPIFPGADVPDRGYWRLLDSIFEGKLDLLHTAVVITAIGGRPGANEAVEKQASQLIKQIPIAVFAKALRAYDRREIENYRALYTLILDYIRQPNPPRPLSVAVFGPPGAGKSFGVKMVAKALRQRGGTRRIETLTFNLSQYQDPNQLASAFHLVRDHVLEGNIPLVFFDEFDTQLGNTEKGWLRYFLAPMQDAEFIDDGAPHPIGQAIFVFAGGTCSSYAEFAQPFLKPRDEEEEKQFKRVKGPDFLSRLRGTLDVPGLDLHSDFDPYGPMEAFPCEAAILFRRAGILAHQLKQKAPQLRDASGKMRVTPAVLRALLHLPHFIHGNRSFEALLDMSELAGADELHPSLLPAESPIRLHANNANFNQLVATPLPLSPEELDQIAMTIHALHELKQENDEKEPPEKKEDSELPSMLTPALIREKWEQTDSGNIESSRRHAADIPNKLRKLGLWFRKPIVGAASGEWPDSSDEFQQRLKQLAVAEHDRWVAEKRKQGFIATRSPSDETNRKLKLHNCLFSWGRLDEVTQSWDLNLVKNIPCQLNAAGLEVYRP